MKRKAVWPVVALACLLFAGGTSVFAQGVFKIPFKFEAGGKKFPAGDYWIGLKAEGQLAIRLESKDTEVVIPYLQKLTPPETPPTEPRLDFLVVGNFEPSYTEYITEYVLSEAWLSGQDGFQVRAMKGTYKHQIVKGQKAAE
jgi:hypothetical protein